MEYSVSAHVLKTIKEDMEMNPFDSDSDGADSVALEMECILAANPITKERLRKIPRTHTYANSLNVFVGRQRSGKSYQAIQEIIKISRVDPNAHLVVYINENGSGSFSKAIVNPDGTPWTPSTP